VAEQFAGRRLTGETRFRMSRSETTGVRLPTDRFLASVAHTFEDLGLPAEVRDSRWRIVYATTELRALMGTDEPQRLGIGATPPVRTMANLDVWSATPASREEIFALEAPFMRFDLPDSEEELEAAFGHLAARAARIEPVTPPASWAMTFDWLMRDGATVPINWLALRLVTPEGRHAGSVVTYGPALPGRLTMMLSTGDPGMFIRMASLAEPAQRTAAVLFADLEASARVARELSTSAYFRLIRDLTTRIDEIVVSRNGIVGKHAGDGVSAFFLTEHLGSEAEAARSALEAARSIRDVPDELAVPQDELAINMGVHWAAKPVIGQLVTGGRLEVTALGDEVNEAARIQQSAHGDRLLVSKDLLERLDPGGAGVLGIDPDAVVYRMLGELPGAGENARRDAGTVAVAEI
jgi:class 3 adenylate cyclase